MGKRAVLLTTGDSAAEKESVIFLPLGTSAEDALGSGPSFRKRISAGKSITWTVNSLAQSRNSLASSIADFPVCSDAVLELEYGESPGEFLELGGGNHLSRSVVRTQRSELPPALQICSSEGDGHDWTLLPSEILELIIMHAGNKASDVKSIAQVCRTWRDSIICQGFFVGNIHFEQINLISHESTINFDIRKFPRLLDRAVSMNNVSACISAARFFQEQKQPDIAHKYWKIAAKKGHPEAQSNLGYAYYTGSIPGVEQDIEEALILLNRSCKQLLAVLSCSKDNATVPYQYPLLMNQRQCEDVLRYSAHILAIIILDGEVMSPIERDTSTAIRWLRISHHYGCQEAWKLLQSLFRSGQY